MRLRYAPFWLRSIARIDIEAAHVRLAHTSTRPPPPQLLRHGLSYHWETQPPTSLQLEDANHFFLRGAPTFLDSATKFRTVKATTMPEVAFLGRSNVGKSSLLNALMSKELCHTSNRPGRTRSMNFFAVGGQNQNGDPGRIAVLDMPGYGKASQKEWGQEIAKYLTKRKQLRRSFVLVDAMHGLKSTDEQMLELLRTYGVPHQVLLSKVDRLLAPSKKLTMDRAEKNIGALDKVVSELRELIQPRFGDGPDALGELIACSSATMLNGHEMGIAEIRHAVLVATGHTSPNALSPPPTLDDQASQIDNESPQRV